MSIRSFFRVAVVPLTLILALAAGVQVAYAAGEPQVASFEPTPEGLTMIAGVALSLAFTYIPGLNARYAELTPDWQRLVMAALLFVVTGAVFGMSCAGIISSVTCDQPGLYNLVMAYIGALVANQSTYAISPRPKTVRKIKELRAGEATPYVGRG